MGKYVLNGKEIEFDVAELDNFERYEAGITKIGEELKQEHDGETSSEKLRRMCNAILDYFDDVIGEGTSESIFKGRINIVEIRDAYDTFISAINAEMRDLSAKFGAEQVQHMNRQQRRAAERKE